MLMALRTLASLFPVLSLVIASSVSITAGLLSGLAFCIFSFVLSVIDYDAANDHSPSQHKVESQEQILGEVEQEAYRGAVECIEIRDNLDSILVKEKKREIEDSLTALSVNLSKIQEKSYEERHRDRR